jgi:ribonuclease P protein component
MIAATHRFHGHASLRFVYQSGRTVRCGQLGLKYAPNNRRTSYRAAVVISKKIHKSAVVRNRLRRRIYEQVRLQASTITAPYDLVFTVFQLDIESLTASQLAAVVTDLLQKSGVSAQKPTPPVVNQTQTADIHGIVKSKDS